MSASAIMFIIIFVIGNANYYYYYYSLEVAPATLETCSSCDLGHNET